MVEEMTCIVCPIGCNIKIEHENDKIISISGNSCPRGEKYARNEVTNPVRMLTSTVKINKGIYRRLPVITSDYIPKNMIFNVMEEINKAEVVAPVKINQVIIKNVCGLGVDIVASRSMGLRLYTA